jgi:hypothetical protein
MWFAIVISTTLATTDLYPAGNSREECERMIEKARAADPQPPRPDIKIICVESSQVENWFKENHYFEPPPEQ